MSKKKHIAAIFCCLVLGAAALVYLNLQLVPLLTPDSADSENETRESLRAEAKSQPPARFKVNRSISRPASEPDPSVKPETVKPETVKPKASSSRPQSPARQEGGADQPAIPVQGQAGDQQPLKEDVRMKEEQAPRLLAALVLYYSPGKWQLDESHREKLNELVEGIGDTNGLWVQIEGHTDQTGRSAVDNERLSEFRADAVADFWVENGIMGQERIETMAFGSSKPVEPNNQPDAWAKNRRAVIRVFKGKP